MRRLQCFQRSSCNGVIRFEIVIILKLLGEIIKINWIEFIYVYSGNILSLQNFLQPCNWSRKTCTLLCLYWNLFRKHCSEDRRIFGKQLVVYRKSVSRMFSIRLVNLPENRGLTIILIKTRNFPGKMLLITIRWINISLISILIMIKRFLFCFFFIFLFLFLT